MSNTRMEELSKVQTNEIETSSLKSQENGLKSSSESLGKHSLSNGSVILKDDKDGIPVDEGQQTNSNKANGDSTDQDKEKPNGLSSNKDVTSTDLIQSRLPGEESSVNSIEKDPPGTERKQDAKPESDSETISSLSSSSDESEDEESENKQEKQKQVEEKKNHDDNHRSSHNTDVINSGLDKDKVSPLSNEKLTQKLQEPCTKCEELKEETKSVQKQKDELEERLSAVIDKNKSLCDTTEHLKKINQELLEDVNAKNHQLQSKLSILEERDNSIEKLRLEIADMKSSRDSLESDLQEAREELNKLQSAEENKERTTKEQEESFDNLKKAEVQEQEIGQLKDQLEMAKKEIEMHGSDKTEVEEKLRDELSNAKNTVRSVNQANSKLEAKLSNSQTIIETSEVEIKKLKDEVKSLRDKIKWLERRREKEVQGSLKSTPRSEAGSRAEQIDLKLLQESQRRTQERVRELEQKVIQVNDEKQKLKHDYDEAVKALEAVDKVYSVRELALQQYKTELDDANELLKQQSSEIQHSKLEIDQLKVDLKRAEQNKEENTAAQEELKEHLTKSKEANRIYKEEIEDVRKELSDQTHELQLAQAKGRERGKKNQILELEVREIKETLMISKNVIEEKEKNMESLREDLRKEKKNCKSLMQELEELDYLKKKLQLIEDEKARIVEKMKRTETDLQESQESLKKSCIKAKEMEKEKEILNKNNQKLKSKCEDQDYQIQTLQEVVESKESDIEQQLIELIHTRAQIDELALQLQDLWASYSADKALWKNRGGRSIRRRHKSAPSKRIQQTPPPLYQSPPESKTHSLAHRRLVNKLGLPVVNPEYINTGHKEVPPATTQNNEVQDVPNGSPPNNQRTTDNTSQTPKNEAKDSPPKLSPKPPASNVDKTKPHRPLSSYGVRTYPPTNGEYNRMVNDNVLNEDVWLHMDGSFTSGDTDEEVAKYLVNKGDRVMIESKVVGDERLNVSGVVKYVGKVGKKTNSPVYVGLKLDQPFGDTNGTVAGKQFFHCEPRHGKLIKMSEINAVMHPRTKNYHRVKAVTLNW